MSENNQEELNEGIKEEKSIDYASLYTGDPFESANFYEVNKEPKEDIAPSIDINKKKEILESDAYKEYKAKKQASGAYDINLNGEKYSVNNPVFSDPYMKDYKAVSTEIPSSNMSSSAAYSSNMYSSYSSAPSSNMTAGAAVGMSVAEDPSKALAIVSLVMGILGILCCISACDVFSILAIVLSSIYLYTKKEQPKPSKNIAVAGFVTGIVGFVISIVLIVVLVAVDAGVLDDFEDWIDDIGYETDYDKYNDRDIDIPYDGGITREPDVKVEKSDDALVNSYAEYIVKFAREQSDSISSIDVHPFETSLSKDVLVTIYSYPESGCYMSCTICHYADRDMFDNYIAENHINEERKQFYLDSMYGTLKGNQGEDYFMYTSKEDTGYVLFWGLDRDAMVTMEVTGRFNSTENRDRILDILSEYHKGISWPVIK